MTDDRGRRDDDGSRDDEVDPRAWLREQFGAAEGTGDRADDTALDDDGVADPDADARATRALPVVDPAQEAYLPSAEQAPRDDAPASQPVVVPPPAADPPRAEGHPQALDLAALRAAVDGGPRAAGPVASTVSDASTVPDASAGPADAAGPRPATPGEPDGDSGGVVPGPFTALISAPAATGPASSEPVAFDWDKVRSVARAEPADADRPEVPGEAASGADDAAAPDDVAASEDADAATRAAAPEVEADHPGPAVTPSPDDSAVPDLAAAPADVDSTAVPTETSTDSDTGAEAPGEPSTPSEPWWVDEHREMTRRERRLAEAAGLPVPPAVAPAAAPDEPATVADEPVTVPAPDAPIVLDDEPRTDASGSWSLSSGGALPDVAATGDVVVGPDQLPSEDDVPSSTVEDEHGPDPSDGRPVSPTTAPAAEPGATLATGWPFATPGAVDPASDAPAPAASRTEPTFTELLGIVPASSAPTGRDAAGSEEVESAAVEPDAVEPDGIESDAVGPVAVGAGAVESTAVGSGEPERGHEDPDRVDDAVAVVDDVDDESDGIDDLVPEDDARAEVDDVDDVARPDGDQHDGDRHDDQHDAPTGDDDEPVDPPTAVLGTPVRAAPASAVPGPGSVAEPLGLVPTGVVPAPVPRSAPATERDGRPRVETPAADALPGVSASAGDATRGPSRASGPRGGRRRPTGAEVEAWAREHIVLLAVAAGVVLLLALVALFFLSRGIAGAAAAEAGGGASVATVAEPSPTVTRTVTAEPVAPAEEPVVAGPLPAGVHSWQRLQGGECLAAFPDAWQQEYEVVDCATPHAAQLTALVQLEGDAASAWPGLEALQAEVATRCAAGDALDRGAAGAYTGVQLSASYPATADDWAAGDRRWACFVSREDAQPLTTSLAPAAS